MGDYFSSSSINAFVRAKLYMLYELGIIVGIIEKIDYRLQFFLPMGPNKENITDIFNPDQGLVYQSIQKPLS